MMRTLTAALLLVAGCTAPASGDPRAATESAAITPAETRSPETSAGRAPAPAPPPERARSVVLVTVDTLRADALGAHGGLAVTPVMDRLARAGWDFRRCISASMLTGPSHASIMTSLYPRDHGVYDNESGIRDGVATLALALSQRGLHTLAVIGFPHLNPEVSGLGAGFDDVVRAERRERTGAEQTAAALAALDRVPADEPFFLWVHYTEPHAPYEPPAGVPVPSLPMSTPMAVAARAAPGFQRHNPWFTAVFRDEAFAEALVARYFGEVAAADRALGELLSGLESRGRLARTAVVVTADHGENLGEHGLYFHHGGLYRETVEVPLVVTAPGVRPAVVPELVATVDIAPTVLELVGAPRWEPMRGTSLVEVARGARPGREVAFSEHMNAELAAAVTRDAELVLHRKSSRQFPGYPFVAGREELYDLRSDPAAEHPLPVEGPGARALEAELRRFLEPATERAPRRTAVSDLESLRALGYLE